MISLKYIVSLFSECQSELFGWSLSSLSNYYGLQDHTNVILTGIKSKKVVSMAYLWFEPNRFNNDSLRLTTLKSS